MKDGESVISRKAVERLKEQIQESGLDVTIPTGEDRAHVPDVSIVINHRTEGGILQPDETMAGDRPVRRRRFASIGVMMGPFGSGKIS